MFLRLYRLDQIPFGLWYDEADFGLNALRLIQEPGYMPVFFSSSRVSAYYIYLVALSFKFFGISALTIRFISVFFGVLTVFAGYLLGKELFYKRTALVFAFLLAVSRWNINWSRIGLDNITVPFFELITLYFIFRALRKKTFLDFTFAGISLGLGLSFYASMRLFPFVIAIVVIFIGIKQFRFIKINWRYFLLFILAITVTSVPIFQYALKSPIDFWSRINETSIFSGKTTEEAWKAVSETTKEHLLMFNYQGDRNGRHNLPGEPMLDPISGTLMVMGIAFSLKRIRKLIPILLIGWFLIMLAPGIFSLDFESPQSLRAIGSLPVAYLFAALAIVAVIKKGELGFPFRERQIASTILVIFLVISGLINSIIYFDIQANSFSSWNAFSTPETFIANKMVELGDDVNYYISTFYFNAPTINFLAPTSNFTYQMQTYDSLPLPLIGDKKTVIFIDKDRKPLFDQAKRYYLGGEFEEIRSPDGKVILYQVILNPSDIHKIQGLNASYFKDGIFSDEPTLKRKETNLSFNFQDHISLSLPYGVEWNGVLLAKSFGVYKFKINSPGTVELYLDQQRISFETETSGEILLAKGNHDIKIRAIAGEGKFELLWQQPGEEWTEISPTWIFVDPVTNNGLLGQYYANDNWQGSPDYAQVDPWIDFYYHNLILQRPYTAEWIGKIFISEDGSYAFGLESVDESSLAIDEQLILPLKTRNGYEEETIQLETGYHTIKVNYSDHTGYTFINLYWTPPGLDREIIPQDVLFVP